MGDPGRDDYPVRRSMGTELSEWRTPADEPES
jgi:hypothetical protein